MASNSFARVKRNVFLALFSMAAMLWTTASVMAPPPKTERHMGITSSAFKDGQPIPPQYSCEGKNISPPLEWTGAPGNAASLALIVQDPDAPKGVWTHWIVFDLPADASGLPEDAASFVAVNARQGVNDFKHASYNGPCPPAGKAHRYFFKIFALDTKLDLPSGAALKDVETAMAKHILAEGQLMGTYQRK